MIYFHLVDDPTEELHNQLAEQGYWEEHHCLDNQHIDVSYMPVGLTQVQESVFEYDGDPKTGRIRLNQTGFVESLELKP